MRLWYYSVLWSWMSNVDTIMIYLPYMCGFTQVLVSSSPDVTSTLDSSVSDRLTSAPLVIHESLPVGSHTGQHAVDTILKTVTIDIQISYG